MFDKLESVVNRHEQIGIELTRPDVASDNELFRKLMKEYSDLTPIVEKYKQYVSAKNAEKEGVVAEAADLLYHVMVLLGARGVNLSEVCAELCKRNR